MYLRRGIKIVILFVFSFFLVKDVKALESRYVDLAISRTDIELSKSEIMEGESFRVYATIRNLGNLDAKGRVVFFLGAEQIGEAQVISIKSGGLGDEVFVDGVAPGGTFNVRVLVICDGNADKDLTNNEMISSVVRPILDTDQDGIGNPQDNCPFEANPGQEDYNNNGKGDVCDPPPPPSPPPVAPVSDSDPDPVLNPISDLDSVADEPLSPPAVFEEEDSKKSVIQKVVVDKNTRSLFNIASIDESSSSKNEELSDELDEMKGLLAFAKEADSESQEREFYFGPDSKVFIDYKQESWNTYLFWALVDAEDPTVLRYEWDFGDGNKAEYYKVKHSFGRGRYPVVLAVMDEQGNRIESEPLVIELSFFNLGNKTLWILVGGLFLMAVTFIIMALYLFGGRDKNKGRNEYDSLF